MTIASWLFLYLGGNKMAFIGNVNKCAVEFTQNSETTLILQPA